MLTIQLFKLCCDPTIHTKLYSITQPTKQLTCSRKKNGLLPIASHLPFRCQLSISFYFKSNLLLVLIAMTLVNEIKRKKSKCKDDWWKVVWWLMKLISHLKPWKMDPHPTKLCMTSTNKFMCWFFVSLVVEGF